MEEIKKLIRTTRKQLQLTQREFAELIGSSQTNVSKYETGETMPPGSIIIKVQELKQAGAPVPKEEKAA